MSRDLAGLAGLGALGYMLANRNKGNPNSVQDTDMLPSGSGQQQYVPTRTQQDSMSDTEFGDLQGAMDAANSRAVMDQFNQNETATKPRARKSDMRTMEYRVKDKADADAIKKAVSGSDYSVYPDESMRGIKPGATTPKPAKRETYRDLSGKVQYKKQKETPVETEKSTARYVRGMRLPDRANVKEDQEYLGSGMKRGGAVKKMASGGMASSASKRADGIATKGKTRGKIC